MLDKEDATPKPKRLGTGKTGLHGARRMKASGNAIFTDKARQQAADLKSRNAYRAAIGLPLVGDPEPLIVTGKE